MAKIIYYEQRPAGSAGMQYYAYTVQYEVHSAVLSAADTAAAQRVLVVPAAAGSSINSSSSRAAAAELLDPSISNQVDLSED